MATWRDTTDHDLGDENDLSEIRFIVEGDGERCPFCDDPMSAFKAYLTCAFAYTRRLRYTDDGYRCWYDHKEIIDKITTCDAESCLKIARALCAKWEERFNARISP